MEKLLYSKLVKEFQYLPLSPEALKENTWLSSNYAQDRFTREFLVARILDGVRKRGLAVSNPNNLLSQLTSSFGDLRERITLRPETRLQYQVSRDLIHLDDIIYYYVASQDTSARDRVAYFQELLTAHASDQPYLTEIDRALTERFATFSIAIPQDTSLFKVRNFLRDTLLGLNTLGFKLSYEASSRLVRSYLSDVYQSLSYDDSIIQELITAYFTQYKNLFKQYSADISKHSSVLAEENQLLSQLSIFSIRFFIKNHTLRKPSHFNLSGLIFFRRVAIGTKSDKPLLRPKWIS